MSIDDSMLDLDWDDLAVKVNPDLEFDEDEEDED